MRLEGSTFYFISFTNIRRLLEIFLKRQKYDKDKEKEEVRDKEAMEIFSAELQSHVAAVSFRISKTIPNFITVQCFYHFRILHRSHAGIF
jgi:hypothetical protein